jgi:hypothetical protein
MKIAVAAAFVCTKLKIGELATTTAIYMCQE